MTGSGEVEQLPTLRPSDTMILKGNCHSIIPGDTLSSRESQDSVKRERQGTINIFLDWMYQTRKSSLSSLLFYLKTYEYVYSVLLTSSQLFIVISFS